MQLLPLQTGWEWGHPLWAVGGRDGARALFPKGDLEGVAGGAQLEPLGGLLLQGLRVLPGVVSSVWNDGHSSGQGH